MNRFAFQLGEELSKGCRLHAFTNSKTPLRESWIRPLPFGKALIEPSIGSILRELMPVHCIYLPSASLTTATMYRAWRLRMMLPAARLHVVGLQRRSIGILGRLWGARTSAQFWVLSHFMAHQLSAANLSTTVIHPGVDAQRFRPAPPQEKERLRAEWHIPENRFVIVHVGPLRKSRNPAWFEMAARQPEVHLLLVGSESQASDREVLTSLPSTNVTVHTSYVANVQDIYRLADAYLFPVQSPTGAMEWPLSVLEALACGIPVLASRFGGLADITDSNCGVVFINDSSEIPAALAYIQSQRDLGCRARRWAELRTWPAMLSPILDVVLK